MSSTRRLFLALWLVTAQCIHINLGGKGQSKLCFPRCCPTSTVARGSHEVVVEPKVHQDAIDVQVENGDPAVARAALRSANGHTETEAIVPQHASATTSAEAPRRSQSAEASSDDSVQTALETLSGDVSTEAPRGTASVASDDSTQSPDDWGHHPGSRLGLDIGGTLTKLIFFDANKRPSWCKGEISKFIREKREAGERGFDDEPVEIQIGDISGTFYFIMFPTKDLENGTIDFVEDAGFYKQFGIESIYAAGGGSFKHAQVFQESLGLRLKPVDELGVVVRGISFMVTRSDQQLKKMSVM